MKSILSEYNEKGMICPLCERNTATELHHLIFGRTGERDLADKDGILLNICHECHENIHHNPYFCGQATGMSKIIGQLAYEKEMVSKGMSKADARKSFIKRYRKSRL